MQDPLNPDRREILKAALAGAALLSASPVESFAASTTAEEIVKKYGGEFGPERQGD